MTNLFILIDFNGMYKDNDKDYIIDKFIKYGIDSEHQKVYLTNGCGTKTRVDTFYELTTGHEFYISCIDRENNKILGFCKFNILKKGIYDAEIYSLYVDNKYKRLGIGSKMFNYVINELKKQTKY